MMPLTSASGRSQFSVENAYTVSWSIPRSPASFTVRFRASVPARCPSVMPSPRLVAQRALPSMMIATYRGRSLDAAEDLFFLAFEQLVDVLDLGVRELLQLGLCPALLVLARLAALAQVAQVVHAVAADVPDRHTALLGKLVHDLHELLAALLGQLRDREPDQVPVVGGREAEVGLQDRLLDRLDRGLVIGRDRQQPCLAGVHRRDLVERRVRAVVVDVHPVEQVRRGTPGADGRELVAGGLDRLGHACASVG